MECNTISGRGKRRKAELLTDFDDASGSDAVCQRCDSEAGRNGGADRHHTAAQESLNPAHACSVERTRRRIAYTAGSDRELSAICDQAHADAERAAAALERVGPAITAETLRQFALSARRKLRNEDGTCRRDHLRAVAQRVEVVSPNEIRILGTKTELLRSLVAAAGVETAASDVRNSTKMARQRG